MANPRRAATIMASRAAIAADRGPDTERYAVPLDRPALYVWRIKTEDTEDGVRILTHDGGNTGQWEEVRFPDRGSDLTDANATIAVSGDVWRVLPAATLTTNRTITLDDELAQDGDRIEVTRLDSTANTVAIVNGGPGAGTLVTLPASSRSFAKFYFDGTDWLLREAAAMPS